MSTPQTEAAPKPNRRVQLIAVVALLLAAGGLWAASSLTWATVLTTNGLSPARTFLVKGADWSPWLRPVGVAFLAAIGAMFALRGWAVRVLAVIVALGGIAVAIPAFSLISEGEGNLYAAQAAGVPDQYEVIGVQANTAPGFLLIVAAVLAVVGGVAMMRTSGQRGMSSKYSSPAARREELERQVFADRERAAAAGTSAAAAPAADDGNERLLWDSLDSGVDPTDDQPDAPDADDSDVDDSAADSATAGESDDERRSDR